MMQGHPANTSYTDQNFQTDQRLRPLVSDIDGTLITTDLLQEAFLQELRSRPFTALRVLTSLFKGRAALKTRLAQNVGIDPSELPWNSSVVDFLRKEHQNGRPVWLASAASRIYAEKIAEYLGFIDRIFASSATENCKGERKKELIESVAGNEGYDYIGDSEADKPLLKAAHQAWVTGPKANKLMADLTSNGIYLEQIGRSKNRSLCGRIFHLLRPHHWLKNLLVFLPLIAGHAWFNPTALTGVVFAFFAFSLIASAGYILNDILDLPFDRRHPRKCRRPIASRELGIPHALISFAGLMALSLMLSLSVGWGLVGFVSGYFVLTLTYSFVLKRKPLIDVLTLALLFNVRIFAGAFSAELTLSYWLIAFTLFLFFGLAVMKRTNELGDEEDVEISGRGYQSPDKQVLIPLGVASSVASAVVLSLYMNSPVVDQLYSHPEWLWLAIPIILIWQCGLWISTVRGSMHDDPLVYAVRYPGSYWAGGAILFLFILSL